MDNEYQGLSPLKILLAEDERAVAFSIAFALKCDGHQVQVVVDGGQALASHALDPGGNERWLVAHSPGITLPNREIAETRLGWSTANA